MDAHTWDVINRLRDWLDAESPVSPDAARLLRVLKIGEEFGEAAEAVHGALAAKVDQACVPERRRFVATTIPAPPPGGAPPGRS